MKFLVFGAGAVGSAIGSRLALAGSDVHLVGRKEHIDKIAKEGLIVKGIWGENVIKNFKLSYSPPEGEFFDVVLITVKTFSTESAGKILKQAGVKARAFISAQNGLGNYEILSLYISPVISSRVIFGVVFEKYGEIEVTVWGGPILFGFWNPLDKSEELKRFLSEVADVFCNAGLDSKYVDDIRTPIWEKVIYNSALNPLSVILGSTYGEIVDNEFSLEIAKEVIFEGVEIARLEGAKFEDGEAFFKKFLDELIPPTREHTSSMIQDIKRRGRTEIDSLCGAIVKYGLKHNKFPKFNYTLWKLIKAIEINKLKKRNTEF